MFHLPHQIIIRLFKPLAIVILTSLSTITFAQDISEPSDTTKRVVSAIPIMEIPQEAFEVIQDLQEEISPILS